jgi:predicted HicB family RNase H-like nuclease
MAQATVSISIRVPEPLYKAIRAEAKRQDVRINALCKQALERSLEKSNDRRRETDR